MAQGLRDSGADVVFITYCDSTKLLDRIKKENLKIHILRNTGDIEKTGDILRKVSASWVVLDGYHFGPDYQRAIKETGCRLLVIDDFAHLEHYYADIILNQNYGAERFSYSAEPSTRSLLGTEYVLLREEFLKYADYKREIPDVAKKLLITMGGGDPENNTLKVIKAVNLIESSLDVKAIIGASNPHYGTIEEEADGSRHNIEILSGVEDMAPLMAWADAAVSAGGTTTWELAFMGLPSLLCIVAENQENGVNVLSQNGFFLSLGWLKDMTDEKISNGLAGLIHDRDKRQQMHKNCRTMTDGRGKYRVIEEMEKEENGLDTFRKDLDFGDVKFISFLNLTAREKEMVRNWRNSNEIREWMFTDHVISKEEHLRFIENLNKDNGNFYWMVKVNDKAAGVGSFQKVDIKDRSGYLGIYSVVRGAGRALIRHLLHIWFDVMKMHILKCELIEGNERACSLYKDFGFKQENEVRFIQKKGTTRKVILMSKVKDVFNEN